MINTLRRFLQRRRAARELDDELRFHIEMETEANIARGMTAQQARRRALAEFGGVAQTREAVGDVRRFSIESLSQDVRYAFRTLSVSPGFSFAAAGMLALAIGITTAMFTVVDALLLRPVPFRDAGQLARLHLEDQRGIWIEISPAVLRAWRRSPAFEAAEFATRGTGLVEAGDTIVTRTVATVTPGVFDMLGVRPLQGRLFDRGSSNGVLISEAIWRTLLGGDPDVIGRTITVDGTALTVKGVLPGDFRFPTTTTALWRPLDLDSSGRRMVEAYVRFAEGVPREDALRLAVDTAGAVDPELAGSRPRDNAIARITNPYSTFAVRLMAGGVALVFLVLCANVCGLLLARLTARRREFSMRAALGASRWRLVRQALVESAIIGAAGVAGGTGIAWALVAMARDLLPESIVAQSLNSLDLDGRALIVTAMAGCAGALLAGLVPAWLGTRVDANESLRVIDRGATETRGARILSRGLLAGEIALACTLFFGAALLVRSFVSLATAERGLDTAGIMTLWINLGEAGRASSEARDALVGAIEGELRNVPGVQQLALSYGVPPRGGVQQPWKLLPDVPNASPVTLPVDWYIVSPEFFRLYRIPIVRGRAFGPSDPPTAIIVSERMAQAVWPRADPVGRSFRVDDASLEVIGVAREIHYPAIDTDIDVPEIYTRFTAQAVPMVSILCRPECSDAALFRHRLATTHPEVRVQSAYPVERDYLRELAWPRATAAIAGAFAVIAVLAAAGGLFAVLTYTVGRRRREFGIRAALGASPAQIRRVVVADGVAVTVVGLAIGSLFAVLLARMLSALQYGVTPGDPLSLLIVVGTIALTTLLAAWRPARAAARVDPVQLLREE